MAVDVEPEILSGAVTGVDRVEPALPGDSLGPLVVPGFLEPAVCAEVRRAMDAGAPEPAEFLDDTIRTEDLIRRASVIEIDQTRRAWLEARLDAERERIERFYVVSLGAREGVSLLRYPPGGFYQPHRDWAENAAWPGAARRQIALVVFLNSSREADPDGEFSGGALRLIADDESACEIHPRAGVLLAFPARTLHEVAPVANGFRDALVDWFY